jgi:Tetratricopeptide repeat
VSLAPTLNALAELQGELGRPDLAGPLFERSLKLRTSVYGDRHPSVARAHGMLAQFAWQAGKLDQARAEFSAAISLHRQPLIDLLPGMAEEDRASYWEEIGVVLDAYTAFTLGDTAGNPGAAGDLYDLQLLRKALMLQCVVSMRAAAAASSDKEIRRQYDDWLAARQLLAAALMSDGPPAHAAGIDQLEADAAGLEKALAAQIGHNVIMASVSDLGWRDVLADLAPSEAAVEIVR